MNKNKREIFPTDAPLWEYFTSVMIYNISSFCHTVLQEITDLPTTKNKTKTKKQKKTKPQRLSDRFEKFKGERENIPLHSFSPSISLSRFFSRFIPCLRLIYSMRAQSPSRRVSGGLWRTFQFLCERIPCVAIGSKQGSSSLFPASLLSTRSTCGRSSFIPFLSVSPLLTLSVPAPAAAPVVSLATSAASLSLFFSLLFSSRLFFLLFLKNWKLKIKVYF